MKLTKRQVEKCQQISNDISKGIDNGDSIAELRGAVWYYAEMASKEAVRHASLEADMAIAATTVEFLNVALIKYSLK